MKKKVKINWTIVFVVILSIIVISIMSTTIYCWITYGNKPVSEVPNWALWFMFGH